MAALKMKIRQLAAGLLAGMLTMAIPAAAEPLRIEGLGPLAAPLLNGVTPTVAEQRLEIRGDDGMLLSVRPWPAFLPQRFTPQTVSAHRVPLPAGPSDRIIFSRHPGRQPWLVIGSGSRSGTPLVGNWQLRYDRQQWQIGDGNRVVIWETGRPLSVTVGGRRWCLYLLSGSEAKPRAGMADESEAQASWVAWRVRDCARQAPT